MGQTRNRGTKYVPGKVTGRQVRRQGGGFAWHPRRAEGSGHLSGSQVTTSQAGLGVGPGDLDQPTARCT